MTFGMCAVSLILSCVHYNTVQRKMKNSYVLAIFWTWIHHRKEAIFMAYSKPKVKARSARRMSFAAGCKVEDHGYCYSCEMANH